MSRIPHCLDNRFIDGGKVSSLSAGSPLPPGRFLVFVSVRGWVDPRATVRLEGSDALKLGKVLEIIRHNQIKCGFKSAVTRIPRRSHEITKPKLSNHTSHVRYCHLLHKLQIPVLCFTTFVQSRAISSPKQQGLGINFWATNLNNTKQLHGFLLHLGKEETPVVVYLVASHPSRTVLMCPCHEVTWAPMCPTSEFS
jgi:hypothetical protein